MTNPTSTGHDPATQTAGPCPLCIYRELSEGTPKIWTPGTAGQTVAGAVLSIGLTETPYKAVPHVDLWLGRTERIRVIAYGATLQRGLREARPQVGDRLTVRFNGLATLPPNPLAGRREPRQYRDFTVSVTRGHH